MGALPNNDPRASFAREQSLRGAFAAMHRSKHLLTPSPQADFGNDQQQVQLAVGDRRSSLKRRHRNSYCRRVSTSSLPISAPPLPFGNNDEPTPTVYQRESSPPIQRHSKRFQPRSFTITANMAQEMVRQFERKTNLDKVVRRYQHIGIYMDYKLGDTVRSPSHTIEPTPEGLGSLNRHDFAFIKRSDGSFSYAILAYRTMEPIKLSSKSNTKSHADVEECMVFVMNPAGSTKMVRKRHWVDYIRLPSSQRQE